MSVESESIPALSSAEGGCSFLSDNQVQYISLNASEKFDRDSSLKS